MHMFRKLLCSTLAFALLLSPLASQAAVETPMEAVPPIISVKNARPMIMLNMSRDHQLFYRAYTEYADLDPEKNDGIEKTYKHEFEYSGYFDPQKCYEYLPKEQRFEPTAAAVNRYCQKAWAGNFLNWATMTRMDIVRKVLYGGHRDTDEAATEANRTGLTVLRRASLPTDAHSFAKHYAGIDIEKLTPYGVPQLTICNTTWGKTGDWSHLTDRPPLMRVAQGDYRLWNANERWQCYWSADSGTNGAPEHAATAGATSALTGAATSNPARATAGLPAAGGTGDNPTPPDYVVRVRVCKEGLIGASEKCSAAYTGGERKPTGLLHRYAAEGLAEFGLLTGSYDQNITGGVLRRNVSDFNSEINQATGQFKSGEKGIAYTLNQLRIYGYNYSDGVYYAPDSATAGAVNKCDFQTIGLTNGRCNSWGNPMGEMFLESLRYLAGKGTSMYAGDTSFKRDIDVLGLPAPEWVDPYTRASGTNQAGSPKNLAERAAVEQRFGKGQCRPVNIVNFNASVVSYDALLAETTDDLGNALPPVDFPTGGDLISRSTLAAEVNKISDGEKISGKKWFVGQVGLAPAANTNPSEEAKAKANQLCTAKAISKEAGSTLADVRGLCPDAPAYKGSFSIAGLAYWAHTNRIRTAQSMGLDSGVDLNAGGARDVAGFVNTYSVALSPGKPRIEVQVNGTKVVIQPAYRLDKPVEKTEANGEKKTYTQYGSGTLVDFRVIEQDSEGKHGKYLIVWEDSEQGGDYDQDVTGTLEYTVTGNSLSITTDTTADATSGPQGFGYTISGTGAQDGVHFHSGIRGFDYTDRSGILGCVKCFVSDGATTATYTVGEASKDAAGSLEDPLWYAAKWGGFDRGKGNVNKEPSTTTITPANYFLVFNPAKLESALNAAFAGAVANSNAAPAVSSSQLNVGSTRYVASFDPDARTGEIEAAELTDTGSFRTIWKASERLNAKLAKDGPANRFVVTDDGGTGVSFAATSLSADYLKAIKSTDAGSAVTTDQDVSDLINYIRGDRTNDGGKFRKRDANKTENNNLLGSIVNSVPWVQGVPSAAYVGSQFPGYADFASKRIGRKRLLWVGANDGMLHAFNVLPKRVDGAGKALSPDDLDADGKLVLSYVPGVLAPRLHTTAEVDGGLSAMFDGSPYTGDVIADGQWRTYLFSSLGRGGKAIYALDVTNVGQAADATPADIFKWRFTEKDDPDLGYVLSTPAVDRGSNQPTPIVKLNNGKFAILAGNGYKSSNGRAVLFLLPVNGPGAGGWDSGNYYKIVAEQTDAGNGSPNGLSAPNWLDLDGNGTADVVYAGDLRGNLWKFDISSEDASKWHRVGNAPLATAQDDTGTQPRLPITTMPQFAAPNFGGLMVLFGTGKAIESGDFPDPDKKVQRVYGIWDSSYLPSSATDTRSRSLLERKLVRSTTTGNILIDQSETYDWTKHNGWFIQFLDESEMVVFNPVVTSGALLFTTARPPKSESEMNETEKKAAAVACGQGPRGRIYVIDPIYGKASTRIRVTLVDAAAEPNAVGTDISSLQGALVLDRSDDSYGDPKRSVACQEGEPGCTCTGTGSDKVCSKPETADGLKCELNKEVAKRFVTSTGDDVLLCPTMYNARIQWREVPGMRSKE